MSSEFLEAITDKYTASELVDILGLSIESILDQFEDEVYDNEDLRLEFREYFNE